jgi:MFS family permease
MNKQKKGWLNRNIFGMGLASFFSDMNHEMASAVLPIFLSTTLGTPAFALGLIEGVADGISTFFEVWAGWFSDRIGKRKGLAAIGYLITALSKGSFAFASSWPQVLIGRTVGWIGWSIRSPVRDALLSESTSIHTVGRAFAFHRTMDTLGAILGPLIAFFLLSRIPIRTIFLISLVPGIFAFLAILLIIKEKAKIPNKKNVWQSTKNLSPEFLSFLLPVGIFGISNFAPTLLILRTQELLSSTHGSIGAGTIAAGLYTLSNIIYAIVGYPLGVLADRYNKKIILGTAYVLFALVCFGFIYVGSSLVFLTILFSINGIYTAAIESSQPALAATLIKQDQRGAGYGVMSAVDGIGDFISSGMMGIIWTYASITLGFSLAGTLSLAAAIMLFILKLNRQPIVTS